MKKNKKIRLIQVNLISFLAICKRHFKRIVFSALTFVSLIFIYIHINEPKFILNVYEVVDSLHHNEKQLSIEALARASEINSYLKKNDAASINKIRVKLNLPTLPCKNLRLNSDSCNCSHDLIKDLSIEVADIKTNISLRVSKGPFEIQVQNLEGFLRKKFGKEFINIAISVKLNGGKYEVIVNESKAIANDFEEAKESVAVLLLKYTSPISYVNLMNNTSNFDVGQTLEIAIAHKLYSNTSAIYALQGEILIDNYHLLQDASFLDKAETSFKQAISSNSENGIAIIGLITVQRIKGKNKFTKNDEQSLNDIIDGGNFTGQAYIEKFKNIYKQGNLVIEDIYSAIEENPNLDELKLFYITFLIDAGEIETAREFLSLSERVNRENLTNEKNKKFELAKIIISLSDYEKTKNIVFLNEVEKQFFKLDFCEKNLWLRYLNKFLENRKDINLKNMLKNQLGVVDQEYKGDFYFYFIYGDVLARLGQKNEAIIKYHEALKQPGPHFMVLSNIANLKLDIGDNYKNTNQLPLSLDHYLEAERYAKKSLDEKITHQAAISYVEALFSLSKFEEHISEFEKWKPLIKSELDKTGSLFSTGLLEYALSNCLVGRIEIAKVAREEALNYDTVNYKRLNNLQSCLGDPLWK